MSITVKEVRRSRQQVSGSNPTAKREYMAWGSAVGDDVEEAVLAVAPDTINSLVFDEIVSNPDEKDETVWEVSISYRKVNRREPPATNDEEISFDLGSQTVKVTQSLETMDSYGDSPPDFKGGIGYDSEKKGFEGCDKMVEVFSFSITKYVPAEIVEGAGYIQNLRDAAFHTNSVEFRGFDEGEVLFVGASGSKRNSEDYAVTFKFIVSRNATGLASGDVTGIVKAGWDYLWALYEQYHDEDNSFIARKTLAAYTERIYDPISLSTYLGVAA